MSPGAAPRTSSLRTNVKNELLELLARSQRTGRRPAATDRGPTCGPGPDRCSCSCRGASAERVMAIVLGVTDALDVIDSDPRPTTP